MKALASLPPEPWSFRRRIFCHGGAKLRASVKEQVLLVGIAGERLSMRLYDPRFGRMLRAIEVQNLVVVADQNKQ